MVPSTCPAQKNSGGQQEEGHAVVHHVQGEHHQTYLFYHVHVYIGDLHLVHPALNLSILDAGNLIMLQQVSLMIFSLNMVDNPMSFLLMSTCNFFGGQVEGTILRCCCFLWDSSFMLKSWWVGGGGLQHFSVSPRPLGSLNLLGLGCGWGLRFWG